MEMLHLNVQGMSCRSCVGHVSRVLDGLAGVKVRSVEIGSAEVEYDPTAASADRVRQALADAGYPTAAATALPLAAGRAAGVAAAVVAGAIDLAIHQLTGCARPFATAMSRLERLRGFA